LTAWLDEELTTPGSDLWEALGWPDLPGMLADLLTAACARVDCREIAEAFLAE
jgi:hypothetical protein